MTEDPKIQKNPEVDSLTLNPTSYAFDVWTDQIIYLFGWSLAGDLGLLPSFIEGFLL